MASWVFRPSTRYPRSCSGGPMTDSIEDTAVPSKMIKAWMYNSLRDEITNDVVQENIVGFNMMRGEYDVKFIVSRNHEYAEQENIV